MDKLSALIGRETQLEAMSRAVADLSGSYDCEVVGGLHVTCADETEREGAEAFHKSFADYHLPRLKLGLQAPFRLANLGARYEDGALSIAEHHYAGANRGQRPTLMVVKVNSHSAVLDHGGSPTFGYMERYGERSTACGALHALLEGREDLPALRELRDLFASGGLDRLAVLTDPERIGVEHRALLASVCCALLQARRVCAEAESLDSAGTTHYMVLPAVVLNRPGPDTEILCGWHLLERESSEVRRQSSCLSDDPTRLVVAEESGGLLIRER